MRLIDADALRTNALKATDLNDIAFDNCYPYWQFAKCIKQAPTIDAVPVVRCKDCKHYNTTGCSVGFGWCESMDRGVSDDFYCSYGERMKHNEN